MHVTGYYFHSPNHSYQPPAQLDSFLKAGKPPVCITFGSMVNRDAERIDRVVRESLRQTDNRGIVLSGWSGIENRSSRDVLYIEATPHDWLLPRCKMVVHHGGAGTTSAGLRAGIPNVIVPFTADQPFWGSRVYTIGVGPRPILVKNLSTEKLVHAIVGAENASICKHAEAIGQRIRGEDGVGQAVALIEAYAAR